MFVRWMMILIIICSILFNLFLWFGTINYDQIKINNIELFYRNDYQKKKNNPIILIHSDKGTFRSKLLFENNKSYFVIYYGLEWKQFQKYKIIIHSTKLNEYSFDS